MHGEGLRVEKPKSRIFFTAVALGVVIVGIPFTDAAITRNKVYPGVRVSNVELGGKNYPEAQAILQETLERFRSKEVTFSLEGVKTRFQLGMLIEFDQDDLLTRVEKTGNTGVLWQDLKARVNARTRGAVINPKVNVNNQTLNELLSTSYATKEQAPQDARFIFDFSKKETPAITIEESKAGIIIDKEEANIRLTQYGESFNNAPIELTFKKAEPAIARSELELLYTAVQELIKKDLLVATDNKSWKLSPERYSEWLQPIKKAGLVELDFNKEKITAWLDEIAPEIEQNPANALFTLSADEKRVEKFEIGKNGVRLPRPENTELLALALKNGLARVALKLKTTPPKIANAEMAEKYGIKELVGSGTTNFKGSPPNRIKNIKRGAALLNGLLIAPGEEFSVLDHLRPFTLENGYLPELVIKASEGRTTPEIGGGLCQIGTTMFRAVLNAGLPVTERRNHSYRVSYYEPPVGMDATIYDPAPDFKFINDTGNWLLLITEVNSTNLTFDLWGTKDGRIAVSSAPEISNFKQPPEKKIIETVDLPPGKIKCTEHAHIGSDARFTYTVTYADGRVEEKEFFSRYRPWQEVCLVGVEKKPEPAQESADLPTPDTTTVPSADTLGVIGESETAPPSPPQN